MKIEERLSISGIVIEPDKCTVCRSCELACSYHFEKEFNPNKSQIKILFEPKTAVLRITQENGCDLCKDEKSPLCVRYCVPGALKTERAE